MCDCFPSLHDSNNGRLRFVIAIKYNPFVGLFVLLFGFLGLDLVDLDAIFRVGKAKVDGE